MNEEWRDVSGYEGKYQVSNLGRVKSLERAVRDTSPYKIAEKLKKPTLDKKGYSQVMLWKNGKYKRFFVHRLVATAFIPNTQQMPVVNHKDCNPKNNHVDNLEWCSQSHNIQHANNMGHHTGPKQNGKDSIAVIQYDKKMNVIREYPSMAEAERVTGISNTSISRCCNGLYQQAGGYIWKKKGRTNES